MKILIIGLGSIGRRHAQILLNKHDHELYALRSGKGRAKSLKGVKELGSWSSVKKVKPDIAFITNPTFLHIDTAVKCARLGCKLFIEKPIGSDLGGLGDLLRIVKKKNLITYVAYNLRFHPVISELKKYTERKKPLHLRAVSTSYLPDWRPNTNHLKSYSANKKMGGGAVLDLSHEIDYISYLIGEPTSISGRFSKRGKVTVDAEDNVDIILKSSNLSASVHISMLSHIRQRYVQVDFDDHSIMGDLLNGEIRKYKRGKLVQTTKLKYNTGQEYEKQMKYFLNNINNPKMMNNLVDASDLYRKIILFKKKNG